MNPSLSLPVKRKSGWIFNPPRAGIMRPDVKPPVVTGPIVSGRRSTAVSTARDFYSLIFGPLHKSGLEVHWGGGGRTV